MENSTHSFRETNFVLYVNEHLCFISMYTVLNTLHHVKKHDFIHFLLVFGTVESLQCTLKACHFLCITLQNILCLLRFYDNEK